MIDDQDLQLVSELRPASADPSLEVVRREREHLMQIATNTRTGRSTRRITTLTGVAVGSVIALGGIAAAAGLIPDAVTERFSDVEQRDDGVEIDNDNALLVASDAASTDAIEMWVAPAAADGECVYVRSSWQRADGASVAENGPIACADPLRPWTVPGAQVSGASDLLGSLDVFPVGSSEDGYRATAVTGSAHPDVATIGIELQDGTQLTVSDIADDGWFAEVRDGDVAKADTLGLASNPAVNVSLFDETGSLIGELENWTRYQAQAIPADE